MLTSSKTYDAFLALVRLGIGHAYSGFSDDVDWAAIKALAKKHGLSAVVLDGIVNLPNKNRPPRREYLTWMGEILKKYEQRYGLYRKAIAELAGWHRAHGFQMMVLKGYACSLDWPKPEHRPCGDIDIWQFGKQKEADAQLEAWFKVLGQAKRQSRAQGPRFKIDSSHHHHTLFKWGGFMVENHYDFLNVHHHKSNVELETILKELGQDDSHYVEMLGEKVYLPSQNLHALFLLRHSMSNFASSGLELRQLLDWGFFVEKQGKDVDWTWLDGILDKYGMKQLFQIYNAICVEDLGFDVSLFPAVQFDPSLKDRVLNDILSPEFSEKEKGGFVRRAIFKYRRWRANAWKHELCFSESMWSAFWSGTKSHLLKPSSI